MKKPIQKPVTKKAAIKIESAPVQINNRVVKFAALICALFAFLLYANTLGHDYTVDDGTVISNNKITKKGVSAIPEIFTTAYRAGFWDRSEGLYRPLSVAMFAIEWELFPKNPAPGHWMNVILYALTAFVMMMTLANIFKEYNLLFPFITTLLFVVHPLHTEVVANIKSRDEILCLLFILLTFFFLWKFLNKKNNVALAFSAFTFFLAFLSKESAITILAVIPLLIWFFSETTIKKNLTISSLYVGVAVIYMFIRYQVLGEVKGSPLLQLINNSLLGTDSAIERFSTAIFIMGKYFYLLFIPHPLSFDYSYNQVPVVSFAHPAAIIALIICLALAYMAFKGISKKDPLSFGILFFFGTISLVANVLFLIESTMAERFLYVPSLGFSIAITFVLLKTFKLLKPVNSESLWLHLKGKPVLTGILIVVMVTYSAKTISRNAEWKDNLTLLSTDVKTSPGSARIRYAYGSALLMEKALHENNPSLKEGYLDKSIMELEKGVAILPNYAEAWNHLGIAFKEKKNYPASVKAFEQARSYKEFKDAEFYISAGLAYGHMQQYDLAIADFTKAISIDPSNAEAFNNKGLYLYEKGNSDSALIYFDKAIAIKNEFYQAYYNKGNTLAKAGKFNEAIELYNVSLNYKPDYVDAWLNIGNSYAALNDYNNAIKYFAMVEQAEPMNRKVLINMGITYRILGDEAKANDYFVKAEKLAP